MLYLAEIIRYLLNNDLVVLTAQRHMPKELSVNWLHCELREELTIC